MTSIKISGNYLKAPEQEPWTSESYPSLKKERVIENMTCLNRLEESIAQIWLSTKVGWKEQIALGELSHLLTSVKYGRKEANPCLETLD